MNTSTARRIGLICLLLGLASVTAPTFAANAGATVPVVSTCAVNFNSHILRTKWLAAAAVNVKCRAAKRLMRHFQPHEHAAVVTTLT
jgi:hypothetical protein